MLEERDRLSHDDNIEELREIIRIRGWSHLVGYLQAIESVWLDDTKLRSALKLMRSMARQVDNRLIEGSRAASR